MKKEFIIFASILVILSVALFYFFYRNQALSSCEECCLEANECHCSEDCIKLLKKHDIEINKKLPVDIHH